MGARRTGVDNYSVHLQLFQHSLSFKVTILMVKRVEVQSLVNNLFRSLGEVIETIIFTG